MHCSDEQLLAHLDGELSAFTRLRVERHLRSCWSCRTRLGACEQEIQKLTVAVDEWPFPAPEWHRDGRQRLNRGMQQIEGLSEKPRRRFAIPAFAAAAAMLLLCVSGWFVWSRRPAGPLHPAEVIAQVSRVEREIYVQPVQQTFSVEIAETRPVRKTIQAKLQIWSDRDNGRFASRFSGTAGALRHALWRPAAGTEFVYRPAVSPAVVQQGPHHEESGALESLADSGLDPAELEAAFLRWLESRSWNPISFASDISSWAATDGSIASAERLRAGDGTPLIRITAERKSRKMVALLTVEVDSDSYRPRLQTIRFETPERTIEFRLTATAIQPIRRSELNAAVFRPDAGVPREVRAGGQAVLPHSEAPTVPPPASPVAHLPAIDPRAMEAQFVLHQARACLGESVRISEDPAGSRIDRIGSDPDTYRSPLDLGYMLGALSDLRRDQPARAASTAALLHAWALHRLADEFPAAAIADLPTASWHMLASMLRDHTAGLRDERNGLGLQPSSNSSTRIGDRDWRGSTASLYESLANPNSRPSLQEFDRRLDGILRNFSAESRGRGAEPR